KTGVAGIANRKIGARVSQGGECIGGVPVAGGGSQVIGSGPVPRATAHNAGIIRSVCIFAPVTGIVGVWLIGAAEPFKDIATHVQRSDPGRPGGQAASVYSVLRYIPIINHSRRIEVIPPGKEPIAGATSGIFPFGLGWQPRAAQSAEIERFYPGDLLAGPLMPGELTAFVSTASKPAYL